MQITAAGVEFTHVDAVNHDGKVVVLGTASDGSVWYTVRRGGFENEGGADRRLSSWENLLPLPLPGLDRAEPVDTSVRAREERDQQLNLAPAELGLTYGLRAVYDSSDAGGNLRTKPISHNGVLYVFRQVALGAQGADDDPLTPHALLLDRFVLDGMNNRLSRKLEVRYKRSGRRYEPMDGDDGDGLDSLDFRGAAPRREPFFEPTLELGFLGSDIVPGRWDVEVVPTTNPDVVRWYFCLEPASLTETLRLVSVRGTADATFDLMDRRGQPAILVEDLRLEDRRVSGPPSVARFDKQTQGQDRSGRTRMLRTTTHLMATAPTAKSDGEDGATLAVEFDLAVDGTLHMSATGERDVKPLRAALRDVRLPLDAISKTEAVGVHGRHAVGEVASVLRQPDDRVRIDYELEDGSSMDAAADVVFGHATSINGRHIATGVQVGHLRRPLGPRGRRLRLDRGPETPFPPGTRLCVRTADDDTIGFVTTTSFPTPANVGSRIVAIEPAGFEAPAGAVVESPDTFEIEAPAQLGEIQEVAAEDALTVRPGQVIRIDRVGTGRVRVHAVDHGLTEEASVRLEGAPTFAGRYEAEHGEHHILIEEAWGDPDVTDLDAPTLERRGVVLTDGAAAHVPVPTGFGLLTHDATIDLWVKHSTAARVLRHGLVSLSIHGDGDLVVTVAGEEIMSASTSLAVGRWHHIALVTGPNGPERVYLDGVEVSTADDLSVPIEDHEQPDEITIGGGDGTVTASRLRLWGRRLSRREVRASRVASTNGNEMDLLGSWPMGAILEGDPRRLVDESAGRRDGWCDAGAHVAEHVLPGSLESGARVVRYENRELVTVVGGAAYEEIVELRAVVDGRALDEEGIATTFAPHCSGRASRTSDEEIAHDEFEIAGTHVESIEGSEWFRFTSRFVVPPAARLIRTLGLGVTDGSAIDELSLRNVRLRLVSDATSRSVAEHAIPIEEPGDDAGLAEIMVALRNAERDVCREHERVRHLVTLAGPQRADRLAQALADARSDHATKVAEKSAADAALTRGENNPLNYYCQLELEGKLLRINDSTDADFRFLVAVNTQPGSGGESSVWDFEAGAGVFHSRWSAGERGVVLVMWGGARDYTVRADRLSDNLEDRWDVTPRNDGNYSEIKLVNRKWRRQLQIGNGGEVAGGTRDVWLRCFPWETSQGRIRSSNSELPNLESAQLAAEADVKAAEKTVRELEEIDTQLTAARDALADATERLASGRAAFTDRLSDETAAASVEIPGRARTWLLNDVEPRIGHHLADGSDGRVSLTYTDDQGALRQAHYEAAATESVGAHYERWRRSQFRHCVELTGGTHIELQPRAGKAGRDISVEMWVQLPWVSSDDYGTVVLLETGSDTSALRDAVVSDSDGDRWWLGLRFNTVVRRIVDLGGIDAGWHHLAIVHESGQDAWSTHFYIDGTRTATASSDDQNLDMPRDWLNDGILAIGRHSGSGSIAMGPTAEVRIWALALTEEEIEVNSRTFLTGAEPGLEHYLPLDGDVRATKGDITVTTGSGWSIADHRQPWTANVGARRRSGAQPVAPAALPTTTAEYPAVMIDPDTGRRAAMMRRFFAVVHAGSIDLLAEQRVSELELAWVGNAQLAPTLLGYIEGPPPVPSENLTIEPSYVGAASVGLRADTSVDLSWDYDIRSGAGSDVSFFVGVAGKIVIGPVEAGKFKLGLSGQYTATRSLLNASSVGSTVNETATDRIALRGARELDPRFPELGARFVPKNVGYALVVSGLADVYVTIQKATGAMVSYEVVPSEDVPPDVNTITFMINPSYTLAGSLDGLTGTRPADDRFFAHVPEMRSQFGGAYPASYYRLEEAYDLKREIEAEDSERRSFFANFDSQALRTTPIDDGAVEVIADERLADQAEQRRQELEAAAGRDDEQRADALVGLAEWQRKIEGLAAAAGKQNIVNTYVWDADGGLRAEQQSFAETIRHTIGSMASSTSRTGLATEFELGVAADLTVLGTKQVSQTLSRTQQTRRALSLEADLTGVESRGVTDDRDRPILPGQKVDRYRFMSFYRAGDTQHFDDFFDQVVDPEWLASNDEEARALRQVDPAQPTRCWRVIHRVTYVERPALLGFGRDPRPLEAAPSDARATLEELRADVAALSDAVTERLRAIERLLDE